MAEHCLRLNNGDPLKAAVSFTRELYIYVYGGQMAAICEPNEFVTGCSFSQFNSRKIRHCEFVSSREFYFFFFFFFQFDYLVFNNAVLIVGVWLRICLCEVFLRKWRLWILVIGIVIFGYFTFFFKDHIL